MLNQVRTRIVFFISLLAVGSFYLLADDAKQAQRQAPAAIQDGISVYFSPNGGCTDAIVAEIGAAKRSVRIQAYSFTSAPIAKAVADAKKRGIEVTAILDASQRTQKYSSATFLHNQGVPVFIDESHAIAHNKVILIDGQTIITGSFNFSKAAEESNAENLLIIRDKDKLIAAYERNFDVHRAHSVRYEGLAGQAQPEIRGPPEDENEVQANVTVYRTNSGKKYHREGCGSLSSSSHAIKLNEAKAKGYTACRVCRPPE